MQLAASNTEDLPASCWAPGFCLLAVHVMWLEKFSFALLSFRGDADPHCTIRQEEAAIQEQAGYTSFTTSFELPRSARFVSLWRRLPSPASRTLRSLLQAWMAHSEFHKNPRNATLFWRSLGYLTMHELVKT